MQNTNNAVTQNNKANMNDSVIALGVELASEVTVEDLKQLDSDTLDKMEQQVKYLYSCLQTVAAQKRAEKMQKEETQKHIDNLEKIARERGNINATVKAFDTLSANEKQGIIDLAKLYHHSRRRNNFTGMEKIKAMIMENLCDLNIGNQYVLGHVLYLAD